MRKFIIIIASVLSAFFIGAIIALLPFIFLTVFGFLAFAILTILIPESIFDFMTTPIVMLIIFLVSSSIVFYPIYKRINKLQ